MPEIHEETASTRSVGADVEIDAAVERVWHALTEASELERWFPLHARVEPGEGGTIWMSWGNEFTGGSRILVWDPPRHLRTTWDGGQVTDYVLEARGGRTHLRVVTSGYPLDADWDAWVEGTRLGWRFELQSLRHYLERQAGRDRTVAYVRRRVPLPADEAWARLHGPGGLGADVLSGARVHADEPGQIAVLLDDPPGALLRVSVEPTYVDRAVRDVTFFLSVWGDDGGRARDLGAGWRGLLERLFPEGETV